jgi:hypothetical protein
MREFQRNLLSVGLPLTFAIPLISSVNVIMSPGDSAPLAGDATTCVTDVAFCPPRLPSPCSRCRSECFAKKYI